MSETVRIGCGSGFWGDTSVAPRQLVLGADLHYLVLDYLSEVSMCLMAAARDRDSSLGFAPDFIHAAMLPCWNLLKEHQVRVLTNAGGLNPLGCAAALREAAEMRNLSGLKVAVVSGDDVTQLIPQLEAFEDGSCGKLLGPAASAHVYSGARPLVRALELGADVVIAGRCVDSALVLAPLIHTFQWGPHDWNLLSAGSLAGHLIECGAQSTGGSFTDWEDTAAGWHDIGFPVVECRRDGSFLLTKPAGSAGLVSTATVSEQLVYEIADPRRFLLPDVCCDWSLVTLSALEGSVLVEGARGSAPPASYKVCVTRHEGFRMTALIPVLGRGAAVKAHCTAQALLRRCRLLLQERGWQDFSSVHVQALGGGETLCPRRNWNGSSDLPVDETREVVLWLAVRHDERRAVELFSREVAASVTGMAPGLTGLVGGRPRVTPLYALHSLLCPKRLVSLKVSVYGEVSEEIVDPDTSEHCSPTPQLPQHEEDGSENEEEIGSGVTHSCPLWRLAHARSGDKGDVCNIGVIARNPLYFPLLKRYLTARLVARYFKHLLNCGSDEEAALARVKRYILPGVRALNFVLRGALGGGGTCSLRPDPQGKGYGQLLLDLELELPQLPCLPSSEGV